jgi:hypothetical protein
VKGYDVSDPDMPNFPWAGRRDASEDTALAALLAGAPADLPAELQPAADVLAALRARPAGDELAGESMALAEFRERVGASAPSRQPRRRRPALLTSLMTAKAALVAAAAAIAIGGVATAAYAGALPTTAQGIAHDWIGAPAAHKDPHHGRPSHPAIKPLCAAFFKAKAHGTKAQQAAALSKLEKAAGGASKVAAYCGFADRKGRHNFRHGCWAPTGSWSARPQPSGSPHPQPSWSPRPQPSSSSSCIPVPTPSPRPHDMTPPHHSKHFPHHVGKPGRPAGNPTPPSGPPTPTPTPSA